MQETSSNKSFVIQDNTVALYLESREKFTDHRIESKRISSRQLKPTSIAYKGVGA